MSAPPRPWSHEDYERAAQEYCERLPPEHFMEATPQATQRKITLASFAALEGRLPRFHLFNELLVQEFVKGQLRQVCPDNMVVLGDLEARERTYYCPELEGAPVFWTMEYVSPSTRGKDFVRNRQIYEQELKVPYYLIFDPDRDLMMLLRLREGEYAMADQDPGTERYRLPELELELALVDGWVRYWHQGELVPLPAELVAQVEALAAALENERQLRQKAEAAVVQREKQLAQRDEQLEQQSEQLAQRDERLEQLGSQLQQQLDEKRKASAQLEQRAEDLRQELARSEALALLLRSVVEPRARQAGRQDILDRLPATSDAGTLQRWLAELGA